MVFKNKHSFLLLTRHIFDFFFYFKGESDDSVTLTRSEFVKMRERMRRELVREIGGDWPNWDRVARTAKRVVENQHHGQESAGFQPLTGGVATSSAAAEYVTERDDLRRWNDYNDTSRHVERPRAGPNTASDLEQKLAKDTDKRERYRKIYTKA